MKRMILGPVAAAALVAAGAAPGAAVPVAQLSAVPLATAQNISWRHRHYRHALIYVGPGLVYGCRPGWYCFGPSYWGGYRPAWYGGFNSIYGYQGARWRPPRPTTATTTSPSATAPSTPDATTPPADQNPPPASR
jgi:hypothetical protein